MAVADKTLLGNNVSVAGSTTLVITTTAAIAIGDLVAVRVAFDNTTATTPTATCADSGGNTYTTHIQRLQGATATAGTGVGGAIMCSKATANVASGGTITITFNASTVNKVAFAQSYTGVENTVRSAAVGNGGATTGGTVTSGTVNSGDLVLGAFANETRANASGDTDTLNGAWGGGGQWASAASGSDATRVLILGSHKITTGAGAQTFNPASHTSADWVALIVVLQASPEPSITQAAYRFYDDAGTESGAAALAAENTAVTGLLTGADGFGVLRVRLQATTAVAIPSVDDFQLQWEKNTSGTWTNVTTGGTTVLGFNNTNLTDGAATTARLTAGTGSFIAGKISETGLVTDLGWTASNYTELVYSLTLKAVDLANGDTLRFRVLRNGVTTEMTYTVTPTINIVVPVTLIVTPAWHDVFSSGPSASGAFLDAKVSRAWTADPGAVQSHWIFVMKIRGPIVYAQYNSGYNVISQKNLTASSDWAVYLTRNGMTSDQTAYDGWFYMKASLDGSFPGSGLTVFQTGGAPTLTDEYLAFAYNQNPAEMWGFRSTDGTAWTQIDHQLWGSDAGTPWNSVGPFIIGGSYSFSTSTDFIGRIYWAEQRTGHDPVGGTLIWRFDANDHVSGTTFTGAIDGRTWTLGSAPGIYHSPPLVITEVTGPVNLTVANAAHTLVSDNAVTTTTAPLIQEGFRWRYDDGTETTATWRAAQDTNAPVGIDVGARLRLALDTTADTSVTPTLYYKKSTDSTWVPVPVGPGGGSPVYVATSTNITAGGEATTALLTPPAGGTFSTGRMWDDENGIDTIAITSGPPPFDPSTISGLFGWFDAADNSSFVYSTEATKSVLWWYDKSPTGWDFETVTSTWESMKPLRDATVNGLPAVRFPPTTYLSAFAIPGCTAQNITEFIVCIPDAGIGAAWVMPFHTGNPGSSSGGYALAYSHPASATVGINYAWTNEPPATNIPLPTGVTVGRLQLDATGKGRAFINGVEALPARTDSAATPTIKGGMGLPGTICEILHYERALTAPEIAEVEDYLMEKWGVWTPAALPGLVGWWDALDIASVSGTATQISQWNDLSGNGHHLVPINTSNTSRLQTIHGMPMVTSTAFNTNETMLQVAGWTRNSVETIIGVVWRTAWLPSSGGRGYGSQFWNVASAGDRIVLAEAGQDVWFSGYSVAWIRYQPGPREDSALHIVAAQHNGASSWFDIDGVRVTGSNDTAAPVGLRVLYAGWNGWPSDPGIAHGELIIVNGTLTPGELAQVYSYLQAKWIDKQVTTPAGIPGLQAWYDAADGSTITSSAGAVSQWNDKSGNIRNATQATGSLQPTTGTRTINGQNALDFTGDRLVAGSWVGRAQPVTVFVVVQSDTSAAGNRQAIAAVDSPAIYASNNFWAYYAGTGVQTTTAVDTAAHVVSAVFNGASSKLWLDSTSISTANPSTLGFNNLYLGGDGGGNDWDGLIAEVLFYNRVLSDFEMSWIKNYLKTKWATPY